MKRSSPKRKKIWWILPLLILAALSGYYFFVHRVHETGQKTAPAVTQEKPGSEGLDVSKLDKKEDLTVKSAASDLSVTAAGQELPEEPDDPCTEAQSDVTEFLRYLDQKPYTRHSNTGLKASARFKKIGAKMSDNLPIPAGEGIDPKMIIRNIYHIFRILDRDEIKLIRDVLRKEQDTMEINLVMLYRWMMLAEDCNQGNHMRPSPNVLYHYAGFFVNTTGGRAYLFRRPLALRLLISYYCVLIIHDADKQGGNIYGIDIRPYLNILREEILNYPHFQFQNEYLNQLQSIEAHYRMRR